jgi:adenosine kinase
MANIMLVGSLTYDRIMDFSGNFADHFLPEKLHSLSVSFIIDRVTQQFGGTAGNIAYNLSLFEIPSDIIATAGTDADPYFAHLHSRGIATESIARSEHLPMACAYVISDKSNNQITPFAPGAGAGAYPHSVSFENRDVVVVSPTSPEDMTSFPARAKEAGVPYFFDPGQQTTALSPEALRAGVEGSKALFVNDYELAQVLERTGWSQQEVLEQTELLVVTLGSAGSRLLTTKEETIIQAVPAHAVDPTGAGDAFRAGFICGRLSGLKDDMSAKIGSTLAAYAVERVGCQNHSPSLKELQERYQASYSEPWPL